MERRREKRREREKDKEKVCVCVRERERARERECVCVCVCERERCLCGRRSLRVSGGAAEGVAEEDRLQGSPSLPPSLSLPLCPSLSISLSHSSLFLYTYLLPPCISVLSPLPALSSKLVSHPASTAVIAPAHSSSLPLNLPPSLSPSPISLSLSLPPPLPLCLYLSPPPRSLASYVSHRAASSTHARLSA